MPKIPFEQCVFINCPFDEDYEPILQAILFCVIYMGFSPKLSTERKDSGDNRLAKILGFIKDSKYSIHDLSRCQATEEDEFFRLNMPFELGIDYGCRQFSRGRMKNKKFLILEEKKYRYQAALSDLSGSDIEAHGGKFEIAIRKVRNWLVSEAGLAGDGASRIIGAYTDFQEWYYKRQRNAGFSDEDIQDYPTKELLEAMNRWMAAGKPI